ncbi:hypothetical protein [Spiroplasma endosymbiont of Nebria brevicollis]|uniref:hypothetical protein n=1 Tax=Spiroplasma endosymbiont of Nebria brevicollis TaxID=3066284 RepID=UPI00313C1483
MTNIEAKDINKEVLSLIELFEYNDKIITIIKTNNECKLYSKEQIELMKWNIDELLYKSTEEEYLIKLLEWQEQLEPLEEHKNLLTNVNKLELIINKFWYKFYWKFIETSEGKLFIKWKNAYLDCYKKHFLKKKNLENIRLKVSKLDTNNNNESEDNKFTKTEINSMDLEKQFSTNAYIKPTSSLKM